MSLRQDLEYKIGADIREQDTLQYAASLEKAGIDRDVADAISALTGYCNALKEALLDAADYIDVLHGGGGTPRFANPS